MDQADENKAPAGTIVKMIEEKRLKVGVELFAEDDKVHMAFHNLCGFI